jgi:nitroimidazol reductase NimA-like FMN-containing flavoprotein (pyridoxamine 5'-phosphate oxidase superfamily)
MKRKGPWSKNETERFLQQERVPLRLACNGASGHPVIASLWFLPLDGTLWCATQRTASLVSLLRKDHRCAFEVARDTSPYRGVRGQALAELREERGEEILRLLIDRYLEDPNSRLARWLLSRVRHETAIAIEPLTLLSWDFRERMGDAT